MNYIQDTGDCTSDMHRVKRRNSGNTQTEQTWWNVMKCSIYSHISIYLSYIYHISTHYSLNIYISTACSGKMSKLLFSKWQLLKNPSKGGLYIVSVWNRNWTTFIVHSVLQIQQYNEGRVVCTTMGIYGMFCSEDISPNAETTEKNYFSLITCFTPTLNQSDCSISNHSVRI